MQDEQADRLTPEMVLRAYCIGAFPMATSRHGEIRWYSPDPRALLPLEENRFRIPRSLRKRVAANPFQITTDQAFDRVIRACAEPRPGSSDTWINDEIIDVYTRLHEAGLAHSVEAWTGPEHNNLVGGLYGVALGSAFFGESMFSRVTDASKVCLVHLVRELRSRGFTLLDVQFTNRHLEQFGVYEIPRKEYLAKLEFALQSPPLW